MSVSLKASAARSDHEELVCRIELGGASTSRALLPTLSILLGDRSAALEGCDNAFGQLPSSWWPPERYWTRWKVMVRVRLGGKGRHPFVHVANSLLRWESVRVSICAQFLACSAPVCYLQG